MVIFNSYVKLPEGTYSGFFAPKLLPKHLSRGIFEYDSWFPQYGFVWK